jgi:hypothetical protein
MHKPVFYDAHEKELGLATPEDTYPEPILSGHDYNFKTHDQWGEVNDEILDVDNVHAYMSVGKSHIHSGTST